MDPPLLSLRNGSNWWNRGAFKVSVVGPNVIESEGSIRDHRVYCQKKFLLTVVTRGIVQILYTILEPCLTLS